MWTYTIEFRGVKNVTDPTADIAYVKGRNFKFTDGTNLRWGDDSNSTKPFQNLQSVINRIPGVTSVGKIFDLDNRKASSFTVLISRNASWDNQNSEDSIHNKIIKAIKDIYYPNDDLIGINKGWRLYGPYYDTQL